MMMMGLPGIRSLLGVALVIVTTGACSKSVPLGGTIGAHDLASGTSDGFILDGGGAGGSGGAGGAGGSGGAGGGGVDMAGGGAAGQICVPTCSACNSNPNAGACCGSACCGYGEWCDAATLTCHCGSAAACDQNSAVCLANTPSSSETCGDYCSPIL
jgi:hypothetical protein